jgi:hypothetical protein
MAAGSTPAQRIRAGPRWGKQPNPCSARGKAAAEELFQVALFALWCFLDFFFDLVGRREVVDDRLTSRSNLS